MTDHSFDTIVVGARWAGPPPAMLLARLGHRVLPVDRAYLPSDTLPTRVVPPPGVAAPGCWGALDRLLIDAASAAAAEVREGFNIDDLLVEGRRSTGRGRHRRR